MSTEQQRFDALVAARLRNFFHHRTPWQRALWGIGTIVGLEEVAEYGEIGPGGGANSNEGLKFVAAAMMNQVAVDEGLGSPEFRQTICELLDQITSLSAKAWPKAEDITTLRQYARRGALGYVDRWAAAMDAEPAPTVETVARLVAPHLLDAGFSADYLNEWLRLKPTGAERLASRDLLTEAQGMVEDQPSNFEVCVPLVRAPLSRLDKTHGWTNAEPTADWLRNHGFESSERIAGSLIYQCDARDAWSAVREAHEVVIRCAARVALAFRTDKELRESGRAYVAGQKNPFQLKQARRQVEVPNLLRSLGSARSYGDSTGLDDAFELAAAMEGGNPGTAITGAWAAIEGTLARPGDKGSVAADRMATLVTCAWPKAELMSLAWSAGRLDSDLAMTLKNMPRGDRPRELERILRAGDVVQVSLAHDQAAVDRMRQAASHPADVLERVRGYVSSAFRRLYTQRNLVMHDGAFQSCALRTTLRTLPPLVGAGLDRIAWAAQCEPAVSALDLAARAEIELGMLGKPGERWLVNLLD